MRSSERYYVHVSGRPEYEVQLFNSFRFSTLNALITSLFGLLWGLGVPFVEYVAAFSLIDTLS